MIHMYSPLLSCSRKALSVGNLRLGSSIDASRTVRKPRMTAEHPSNREQLMPHTDTMEQSIET